MYYSVAKSTMLFGSILTLSPEIKFDVCFNKTFLFYLGTVFGITILLSIFVYFQKDLKIQEGLALFMDILVLYVILI